MEFLDQNTVCHMCRHLVTHYFLLSSDDLALWDAEPESFATDEAGESWKYSLRVSLYEVVPLMWVNDFVNRIHKLL